MKYKGYLVEENDGFFSGSISEIDAPAIELGTVSYTHLRAHET